MQIIRQGKSRLGFYQIDGAGSDVLEGALVMPGTSAGTNLSVLVAGSGAAADAMGILASLHDFSDVADADPEAGTNFVKQPVHIILPGDEVSAEFDNSSSSEVTVTSFTTATASITSMEDSIDGSWSFCRAGASAGLLAYIDSGDTAGVTFKTVPTTALDSSSRLLIMRRRHHQVVELLSGGVLLSSSNTAGSLPWRVLDLMILEPGASRWESLDPTKHDNTVYGSATGINAPRFRAILSPANTTYSPTD